jgi:hypothetical protein
MISEDVDESFVNVNGFGRMSRRQALRSAAAFLRNMAEKIEEDVNIPLHYFDMAKDHYKAAISDRPERGHSGF